VDLVIPAVIAETVGQFRSLSLDLGSFMVPVVSSPHANFD